MQHVAQSEIKIDMKCVCISSQVCVCMDDNCQNIRIFSKLDIHVFCCLEMILPWCNFSRHVHTYLLNLPNLLKLEENGKIWIRKRLNVKKKQHADIHVCKC